MCELYRIALFPPLSTILLIMYKNSICQIWTQSVFMCRYLARGQFYCLMALLMPPRSTSLVCACVVKCNGTCMFACMCGPMACGAEGSVRLTTEWWMCVQWGEPGANCTDYSSPLTACMCLCVCVWKGERKETEGANMMGICNILTACMWLIHARVYIYTHKCALMYVWASESTAR